MASTAFTSAGTVVSISATLPASEDQAGYEALTWAAIGEMTDFPEIGKSYTFVNHNPLGDRQTVKRKGSYNNGSVTMQMALDTDDAGQVIIQAGLASDNDYAFKVALPDGTARYFLGQVGSYTFNVGTVDSITTASVSLEVTAEIITV